MQRALDIADMLRRVLHANFRLRPLLIWFERPKHEAVHDVIASALASGGDEDFPPDVEDPFPEEDPGTIRLDDASRKLVRIVWRAIQNQRDAVGETWPRKIQQAALLIHGHPLVLALALLEGIGRLAQYNVSAIIFDEIHKLVGPANYAALAQDTVSRLGLAGMYGSPERINKVIGPNLGIRIECEKHWTYYDANVLDANGARVAHGSAPTRTKAVEAALTSARLGEWYVQSMLINSNYVPLDPRQLVSGGAPRRYEVERRKAAEKEAQRQALVARDEAINLQRARWWIADTQALLSAIESAPTPKDIRGIRKLLPDGFTVEGYNDTNTFAGKSTHRIAYTIEGPAHYQAGEERELRFHWRSYSQASAEVAARHVLESVAWHWTRHGTPSPAEVVKKIREERTESVRPFQLVEHARW